MIDINKKYKTRQGEEVRIYATDVGYRKEIHGAILYHDQWILYSWEKDGEGGYRGRDLIEIKPKIKAYILLFQDDSVSAYTEKDRALREMYASKKWNTFKAATEIEVDFEEGQELHG